MKISKALMVLGGLSLGFLATAEDVIIRWNRVLRTTIRADGTLPGPAWASRNGAVMHLAVYEAVNSIHRNYEPFYQYVPASAGASAEAAAAQAAARVLMAIYPAQSKMLGVDLNASLRGLPEAGKEAGIVVGNAAAELVLARRSNDGSGNELPYTPGTEPGRWRPDPLHPQQTAVGAHWGRVAGFALSTGAQFRSPPPPPLASADYAAAWLEVLRLGSRDSAERTTEQTEIGMFWGYDRSGFGPPPILYTEIAEIIAEQRKFSLDDNARLFAMVGVAMADAGIACWESKYHYNFWRPIGGIREADTDGNTATPGDPAWIPLGAPGGGPPKDFTPPFPAYPSGHATFGAAAFRILELACGSDNVAFTAVSEEIPAATRSFQRFSQASEENGRSRIYLGIHWNFDDTEGRAMGRKVADQVFTTRFAPVLRTVRKGQHLEMRWPASVRSYEVHQNTALIPFQWVPMSGQSMTEGDQQMMVTPMEGASFYRLARVGTPHPN